MVLWKLRMRSGSSSALRALWPSASSPRMLSRKQQNNSVSRMTSACCRSRDRVCGKRPWPALSRRQRAGLFADRSLGVDFQAEAREIARLHLVVDEEAEADGDGNDAGSGDDEQHMILQNGGEQQSEDDDTDAAGKQDHGRAADVVHGADGV